MLDTDERVINLKNDWMFKAFMTNLKSRKVVSSVISEITGIDKEELFYATYISGEEISKRNPNQKKQATDMTIRINDHMQVIVEMNQYYQKHILIKNGMYALSKIVETTTSNHQYSNVILINFDNFNYYQTKEPILTFRVQDKEGHIEFENYISYHIILENCENSTYNVGKEIKKFAKLLKEKKTINELLDFYKGDEEYMSVVRTVKELSTDPEFAGYYDLEEKHRQQIADAKETGMDEGLEKGKNEATHSIAKKMLQDGINIDAISKYTGLSIEEIEKLKEEN